MKSRFKKNKTSKSRSAKTTGGRFYPDNLKTEFSRLLSAN